MKRDMDLVRNILLKLENTDVTLSPEQIESHSVEEVSYHIMILNEAGLVIGQDQSSLNDTYWFAHRLTWNGHEFLEAAKDDTVWKKAKAAAEKGGGLVFEILREVLIKIGVEVAMSQLK